MENTESNHVCVTSSYCGWGTVTACDKSQGLTAMLHHFEHMHPKAQMQIVLDCFFTWKSHNVAVHPLNLCKAAWTLTLNRIYSSLVSVHSCEDLRGIKQF